MVKLTLKVAPFELEYLPLKNSPLLAPFALESVAYFGLEYSIGVKKLKKLNQKVNETL
jgi:hypothetical protein